MRELTRFLSRIALLLLLSHRIKDREMSESLLRSLEIAKLRRLALVDRSDVFRKRNADFRSVLQELLASWTSEAIPAIVNIPRQSSICRRSNDGTVEKIGDEIPVRAVLLSKRDEQSILLRSPEQRCCAEFGVRERDSLRLRIRWRRFGDSLSFSIGGE